MPVSHDYLSVFAGNYGGGGNRTRVGRRSESPQQQQKRGECIAAYRQHPEIVNAIQDTIYEERERLQRGPETNLYVIFEAEGAAKFGVAVDPIERLKTLQNANWRDLILFAACPGTVELERAVFDLLSDDRIRGEWFRCSPAVHVMAELMWSAAEMCAEMLEHDLGPLASEDTISLLGAEMRREDEAAYGAVA